MPVIPAIPIDALVYGFAGERAGTLSGKTLMVSELRQLLDRCPANAALADYRAAILDQNVLLKPTRSTRGRSVRHLREWYALDRRVLLFRALRDLWDWEVEAQPALALLCAAGRNDVLRGSAAAILSTPVGAIVTPAMLVSAAAGSDAERWNATTRGVIGRNAAASWLQSGHLSGHRAKRRVCAVCRPAAATYALLLGYLCGDRGEGLFRTFWARLLDASVEELRQHTLAASQRGWLEYRHAGGITDVGFRRLLGNGDQEARR